MYPEYRYEKLKWKEVDEAAQRDRVVVVPIACVEDHGPHLPLDVDIVIVEEICHRTAKLLPDKVLIFPTLQNGYDPHHMDFPGTITIQWKTLVEYMLDITRSLAHHGFRRFIVLNSHGSNTPLVELIARLTMIEFPHVLATGFSWWQIPKVREEIPKFRESEFPGGMSHACELETSAYLAIDPEGVDMSKAVKDIQYPKSRFFNHDLAAGGAGPSLGMMEWWSTLTETGVMGDATKATKEKGEQVLRAAAEGLRDIISELSVRQIRRRIDHHTPVPKSFAPNTWETDGRTGTKS
jgi:creatinine amidohydrolase